MSHASEKGIGATAANPPVNNIANPYELLFGVLPYGAVLFDATLSIAAANPAAMKMLGLSERHLGRDVGSPEWHFTDLDGRRLQFHELPLSKAFASAKPVRNSIIGVFNPKEKKQVWLRIDVLPHQAGRQLHYWAIFHDITRELELEAALA